MSTLPHLEIIGIDVSCDWLDIHCLSDSRRVLCREVEASGVPASETGALHAAAEAEFGRSLPLLTAELPGGGVPDLDAIETSVRDGVPGGGAKRYAALLETVDAHLAGKSRPSCPSCGRRMERRGRVGKTFGTRLGEAWVRRHCFYCRKCGVGDYPLDRALRLAGKRVTPGAEAVYADVAGSDSCGEARRKLWNLAGAAVSRATLQRHSVRIGEEMQAFEREDAEAASPAAERVLPGIDGTGVPMAAREVEGVAGKQADGTAKTREAKAVTSFTADGRDPKTGEPRKDKDSGAAGVRLRQFGLRNGLFAARELAVLSDGAPWIRNSCEEAFPGQETTFILDLFHALEYADAAVKAAQPDKSKQEDWMKTIKGQPDAGRVDDVIADLEPHRRLEAVATCIRYYGTNRDRMRYDLCRKRGLPVGSGVVESACKQIVGSRFKGAGRRWSKIGANAVLAIKCCFRNNRWPDFLNWCQCRSKIPHFSVFWRRASSVVGSGLLFGSPSFFRRGRRRDGRIRSDVFGNEVGVLSEPVACAFDSDDDGVVEEPVEEGRRDDGVSEDVAPFGEASVRG